MMKRTLLLIAACLVSAMATGQSGTVVHIQYMPSLSLGNTADFTRNLSPRGTELVVERFLTEELSLGIAVGWSVFREKVTGESFHYNEALVTGTQFRYTNILPLNVMGKKYFGIGDRVPFLGLGVGTSYARQTNNAGIFSIVDSKWQFNLSPEVGVQARVNPDIALSLKVKYSYSFESGDFPGMSFLGLGIGIGFN